MKQFLATGIGSMPFSDPEHAVEVALRHLPEAPQWPQLPKLGMNEQMEIQYSEGMPCTVTDLEKQRIYFDTSGDTSEALAEFYETYMAAMDPEEGSGDCSALAVSSSYSRGLHAMLGRLRERPDKLPYAKLQTTGPCSFGLTIVDENKRAIFYNEEFRDVVVKALAMKCRWQIQQFTPLAEKVICFIDEPILSAFGSSTYVSVSREEVVHAINECVQAIHAEGALAGVHCCGNTDWSLPIEAEADIVNFDAFEYGETLAMYPDAVRRHLERGGVLAWGIVPTSEMVVQQTAEGLVAKLEKLFDKLAAQGIDRDKIVAQAAVTPACGTGSLSPEQAETAFRLTHEVSEHLRGRYS